MRLNGLVIFIIIISGFCFSMYSQEKPWNQIIQEGLSVEDRRYKLDSLLVQYSHEFLVIDLADCYHDTGNRLYYRTWLSTGQISMLDSAIKFTKKSASIKRDNEQFEANSIKKSLFNLGYFYSQRGKYYESADAYEEYVNMGGSEPRYYTAYKELGKCFQNVGDFHKSIAYLNRLLQKSELSKIDPENLLYVHIDLANTYSTMGHWDYQNEIKFHLSKADSIYGSHPSLTVYDKANIDQLWGNLWLMIGEYQKALVYHNRILAISKDFSHSDQAMILNSLGRSLDKTGKDSLAKEYLEKALELNPNFSAPYDNLGDLYIESGDFLKGLRFYQMAISSSTDPSFNRDILLLPEDSSLEHATNQTFLLNYIIQKANGWLRYYKETDNRDYLKNSIDTFLTADQLIDIIRNDNTEFKSRLYWREQSAKLYMKAVEACYLLDNPAQAYYFMERNKAMLLLEEISHEQAKELSNLPDSIAKREFEHKRNLYLAENSLKNMAEGQDDETQQLKDDIFSLKRDYERFLDTLDLYFPDYARLKTRQEILPLSELKSRYCNEDQVVLQYILNDEQGYGLFHSTDKSEFFELAVEDLNDKIGTLQDQLASFSFNPKEQNQFTDLSYEVYNTLIPEEIRPLLKDKQVVLIPDYSLQRIPFEVLVTNKQPLQYLIDEAEIRYAYSISYLDSKNGRELNSSEDLLALAPVRFETLGLGELRYSGPEVVEVQQAMGGLALVENSATKNSFVDQMDRYRILHLSTHADIAPNGNHWVAFKDDKLYLNEIYANRNEAEMVVLSACNTSRGELKKGEGVMSLARAFFNSGAKSVVSSLWPVHDKSGKDIMVSFYNNLDKGLTKSAALRQAKLEYRKNNADLSPAYWAALIVIGDNSPLATQSLFSEYWWLLIPLLIILILIGYRRFKMAQ